MNSFEMNRTAWTKSNAEVTNRQVDTARDRVRRAKCTGDGRRTNRTGWFDTGL